MSTTEKAVKAAKAAKFVLNIGLGWGLLFASCASMCIADDYDCQSECAEAGVQAVGPFHCVCK